MYVKNNKSVSQVAFMLNQILKILKMHAHTSPTRITVRLKAAI